MGTWTLSFRAVAHLKREAPRECSGRNPIAKFPPRNSPVVCLNMMLPSKPHDVTVLLCEFNRSMLYMVG